MGKSLYAVHCASCHGLGGRGDGPLRPALTTPPSDLTLIAHNNGGRFQESKVLSTIDGRYAVAAHGPRDMPVWGVMFTDAHREDPFPVHRGLDDARALVDYLRTLQEPGDAAPAEAPPSPAP